MFILNVEPVFCVIVQVVEQGHLKALSSSVNTMQQVLEEAGQLLKLVWRVSLPSGTVTATSNQQVHTLTQLLTLSHTHSHTSYTHTLATQSSVHTQTRLYISTHIFPTNYK